MPISLQCQNCAATYQVKDEMAGKRVKCRCGNAIQVPAAQAPADQFGGGGLDPLGVGGDALGGNPQQPQWGAQQQAPMQFQQQPQPTSSWSGHAAARPKTGGSANTITILEVVASSLCILQGGIVGIMNIINFINMLDFLGSFGVRGTGWFWVFALLELFAGLASLCMLAFGICLLVDAIMRLSGNHSKVPWSPKAVFAACLVFVGLHALGMLLLLIMVLGLGGDFGDAMKAMFVGGGWRFWAVSQWSFLYLILLGLVPTFMFVVFALRAKQRR